MNKRWKPDNLGWYWYVCISEVTVRQTVYEKHRDSYGCLSFHERRSRFGNCFRTKKEAQEKLRQIEKILKERE
jgi:hypothetical protein